MYLCTKIVPKMNSDHNRYKFIVKNSINSTNSCAKELILSRKCKDRTVIVAETQTEGRGQHANVWESESGKNLTFSLVYFPESIPASCQFYLSRAIALGVADYLSGKIDEVSIKWPNDIYVGNNKIAGILIENTIMGSYISSTICGIGININQEVFYSEAPNPVSLIQITGTEYKLNSELEILIRAIENRYQQLDVGDFKKLESDYMDFLYRKIGYHSFSEEGIVFKAKIAEITDIGQMVLEKENGERKAYSFKEVSYVL